MRDKYLKMRKRNSFETNWFYDYYVKAFEEKKIGNKHRFMDRAVFESGFRLFFSNNKLIVLKALDIEFKVTLLENKKGEIINVY